MKIDWWVFRVILPLSPLWLTFLLCIVVWKWTQLLDIFKGGQLFFFAVSLSALTMSEYDRLAIAKDGFYYFELLGVLIASSFLFGVATLAKQITLDVTLKEKIGKGIAFGSLLAGILVILCSYWGLGGRIK